MGARVDAIVRRWLDAQRTAHHHGIGVPAVCANQGPVEADRGGIDCVPASLHGGCTESEAACIAGCVRETEQEAVVISLPANGRICIDVLADLHAAGGAAEMRIDARITANARLVGPYARP